MLLNKTSIQKSFSRQAVEYNNNSGLQKNIAEKLLEKITYSDPSCILEIGCGTGNLTNLLLEKYPSTPLHAIDLAPGMVRVVKKNNENVNTRVADAEDLPFSDQAFDLIVSSTALQWMSDLTKVLNEVKRCLRGDGQFIAALFGGKTLFELKESYALAFKQIYPDRSPPLHNSIVLADLIKALDMFQIIALEKQIITKGVPDLKSILRQLKSWGAQNAHNDRLHGLGQRKLLALTEEIYRSKYTTASDELNVTWEVHYLKVKPWL